MSNSTFPNSIPKVVVQCCSHRCGSPPSTCGLFPDLSGEWRWFEGPVWFSYSPGGQNPKVSIGRESPTWILERILRPFAADDLFYHSSKWLMSLELGNLSLFTQASSLISLRTKNQTQSPSCFPRNVGEMTVVYLHTLNADPVDTVVQNSAGTGWGVHFLGLCALGFHF